MRIQAPDIPRPKYLDDEYMNVWHRLIDKELDCFRIRNKFRILRRNFYIVVYLTIS